MAELVTAAEKAAVVETGDLLPAGEVAGKTLYLETKHKCECISSKSASAFTAGTTLQSILIVA
jgi:hypothetical protein